VISSAARAIKHSQRAIVAPPHRSPYRDASRAERKLWTSDFRTADSGKRGCCCLFQSAIRISQSAIENPADAAAGIVLHHQPRLSPSRAATWPAPPADWRAKRKVRVRRAGRIADPAELLDPHQQALQGLLQTSLPRFLPFPEKLNTEKLANWIS